jgi:CMP-N-acetylneuraminic acid synthetase
MVFKDGITAVIPVKKNSSRLKNKNILPFGSSTLLEHKISQLQRTKGINRILVSSDSDEMLAKALDMGVDAVKRPNDLANESRPLTEFFSYIATLINDEHMMWACCTSPLFGSAQMTSAIDKYLKVLALGADSLITVTPFQHYLMDESGPLNYALPMSGALHSNSQDLPTLHSFTNGILLAPLLSVKSWEYNYGPKAYRFEVSQDVAIDIDTYYDYIAAKAWYEKSPEKYI